MLSDNVLLCALPMVMFTLAATPYIGASPTDMLLNGAKAAVLDALYSYAVDSSNQVKGEKEDRLNKPYRPIPAGLTDSRGMLYRFVAVMLIYTLVAWRDALAGPVPDRAPAVGDAR
jgi:4-hydroxybenzoate polyprenyltransferase